jgi:hypothetical protein
MHHHPLVEAEMGKEGFSRRLFPSPMLAYLRLPPARHPLPNAHLLRDFRHDCARFRMPQRVGNLLLGVSALLHRQ